MLCCERYRLVVQNFQKRLKKPQIWPKDRLQKWPIFELLPKLSGWSDQRGIRDPGLSVRETTTSFGWLRPIVLECFFKDTARSVEWPQVDANGVRSFQWLVKKEKASIYFFFTMSSSMSKTEKAKTARVRSWNCRSQELDFLSDVYRSHLRAVLQENLGILLKGSR